MKKQFFINEIPVSRVAFQWTVWSEKGDGENWLETDDLTPRKLKNRMANGVRYEDIRIATIGFEPVDYVEFSADFKDDGAHLYTNELTTEQIQAAELEYLQWDREYEAKKAKEAELLATVAEELPDMDPDQNKALAAAIAAIKPDADPEWVKQLIDSMKRAAEILAEIFRKVVETAKRIASQHKDELMDAAMLVASPPPKWWHLYKHAKKARVRKKYKRKLMDNLLATVQAAGAI
jgi:hypothetical protein